MPNDQLFCNCEVCETAQPATPNGDGTYTIDRHHESNDTPECAGSGSKVGAHNLVKPQPGTGSQAA